jgi:pilus assembly protein Flp/PilA
MFNALHNILRNDEGATMVEYGVMVALIAAVCIAVVTTLGKSVSNAFSTVNASI